MVEDIYFRYFLEVIVIYKFMLKLFFLDTLQNQMPGAEEAFKILGHAFDLIGEPVSDLYIH